MRRREQSGRRHERPEFELDKLVRREFKFELAFAGPVVAVLLADARRGIDRELLFAFEAYAGTLGETEDVFRFYLAQEWIVILSVGGEAICDKEWRGEDYRPRKRSDAHLFPHTPDSRSGNQVTTFDAWRNYFQIVFARTSMRFANIRIFYFGAFLICDVS